MREKASKCEFEADELNERLIEMVILSTPFDDFRKELLVKAKNHPVTDVLERGREYEAILASQSSLKSMNQSYPTTSVDAVNHARAKPPCGNCATRHAPKSCPAYEATCAHCKNKGHYARCCRIKKREDEEKHSNGSKSKPSFHKGKKNNKKLHSVNSRTPAQMPDSAHYFHSIKLSDIALDAVDSPNEAFIMLHSRHQIPPVSGYFKLKIDPGSGGNTLPLRTYRQMFGEKPLHSVLKQEPSVKLTSYSGDQIKCLGSILLDLRKESQSEYQSHKFYVVDVKGPALLGLPSCNRLKVVKINVDNLTTEPSKTPSTTHHTMIKRPITSVHDLQAAYPSQFDTIGKFKDTVKLYVKDDAVPFIDAPRKTSIHLRPKIKQELDSMEKTGVIRRVTEHSDWCSSLVYVTKTDGSLRICLDPQKLNQSLRRCPHKIPTLEELNPEFSNAQVFSKLDAKAGYWSIGLHEDSQLLTTFRTPFGRYCWKRLPFGLNVSQDIFQARMDTILEGLPGIVNIADDICVFGATQSEHDDNLARLMKKAHEEGLVFNSTKCSISKPEIHFFGNLYTANGIQPDPRKIRDVQNMPSPQTKEDLQRFLGVLTYLSAFIPNFSEEAKSLRDLLKNDTPFEWSEDHEYMYTRLKKLITKPTTLAYYDPSKGLTLEVDGSMKGLGAAILQNGRVIAFASKTLTTTQSNYSNIEREALSLVHGIQRFHTYLYGRNFKAITDHKPLVNIWNRPLTSAPPRLQRLLLKIQGYNFQLEYKPGPELVLSDTLSRLPNPENNREIPLDLRVDGLEDDSDISIESLNFSETRLEQIRTETNKDPILCQLKEMIVQGWPVNIQQCHTDVRQFFNFRECLGVDDGIIFKGRQVLIPKTAQGEILRQLHISHQGIQNTQALARESVYWPGINKDIEDMVRLCDPCQKYQPKQPAETSLHHTIPPTPWTKVGSDLFQIGSKHYLLIVDYFTKFPIVRELPSTTSAQVTKEFRYICGILGRPTTIISDNGPQYTGSEFKKFVADWDIQHTTSSPHYPRSNGVAERNVGTVKHIIVKCFESNTDIDAALLQLRATPIDCKTASPSELLLKRKVATLLPCHIEPTTSDMTTQHHLCQRLPEKNGTDLPSLYSGQPIRIYSPETRTWQPGSVVKPTVDPRSYLVETERGNTVRRNRSQLREVPLRACPSPGTKTKTVPVPIPESPDVEKSVPTTEETIVPAVSTPRTTRSSSGCVLRPPKRYDE